MNTARLIAIWNLHQRKINLAVRKLWAAPVNPERRPMKPNHHHSLPGLIVAVLLIAAPICRADLTFGSCVATAGLRGQPAGPFYVDF